LSYSGKAKGDRASSDPPLSDDPELHQDLPEETWTPAKAITEIKKLMVLRRVAFNK
jgi:hypothetical protein